MCSNHVLNARVCSGASYVLAWRRRKAEKTPDGEGQVALYNGILIGHKKFEGNQRVYAVPFPLKKFRGKVNRQDFVLARPIEVDEPNSFHPDSSNVWFGQCLWFLPS